MCVPDIVYVCVRESVCVSVSPDLMHVCVCVCLCVCVCERESVCMSACVLKRERERKGGGVWGSSKGKKTFKTYDCPFKTHCPHAPLSRRPPSPFTSPLESILQNILF